MNLGLDFRNIISSWELTYSIASDLGLNLLRVCSFLDM
jgi:hypothetical protein